MFSRETKNQLRQHAIDVARKGRFAPDAVLDITPDPDVVNAFTVRETASDTAVWVGPNAEVEPRMTLRNGVSFHAPMPQRSRYLAAVEAVRRAYKVAVPNPLAVVPDSDVKGAFFVADFDNPTTVRWVSSALNETGQPEYTVFTGFVEGPDEVRTWDPQTLETRENAKLALLAEHDQIVAKDQAAKVQEGRSILGL